MDIPSINMPPPSVEQPGNERYVPDSHEFENYILPSERKKRKEKDKESEENEQQNEERHEQPEDRFEREKLNEGAPESKEDKEKAKLKEAHGQTPLAPDAPGNFVDIKA